MLRKLLFETVRGEPGVQHETGRPGSSQGDVGCHGIIPEYKSLWPRPVICTEEWEQHEIEKDLKAEANRLSEKMGGAPVVILVAGDTEANVPRTMTASSIKGKDIR